MCVCLCLCERERGAKWSCTKYKNLDNEHDIHTSSKNYKEFSGYNLDLSMLTILY